MEGHMKRTNMIIGITIVLLIYSSAIFYIGNKLYRMLEYVFPNINGIMFALIYSLISLTLLLSFLPLTKLLKRITTWIGAYWMGIFVYLLLFFVMSDVVLLVAKVTTILPSPVPIDAKFYASVIAILLTMCFVIYGIYNATKIKLVSYAIKTNKKVNAAGMKIVLISDLHLGALNSEKRLDTIVYRINQLKPDIVCIAGDIFNDNYDAIQNPKKAIERLKSISATYGVFGSFGNHDGGKTFDKMVHFLHQSNIKLLKDEYITIDNRLALFGRLDPSPIGGYGKHHRKDIANKLNEIEPGMAVVVMDHTPSNLHEYGNTVDLVVAGHTHKGQLFPGNLITRRLFVVDYGYYRKDSNSPHVIVSSGVGTWGMPMRVGSNNEIVSIQLD